MCSICSLLWVSTAVRHTVQSCRAHFKVHLSATSSLDSVKKLRQQAGAMRWLPHHAGLVSELVLGSTADDQATADTVGELALQLCAQIAAQAPPTAAPAVAAAANGTAGGCSSAGAADNAAGGILQSAAPLPLRLKSFSSSGMPPATVLRLLQPAGLQRLQVEWRSARVPVSLYPAHASMQELTEVSLSSNHGVRGLPLPMAFASALGQLQHLTSLTVCHITPAGARLLPVSLKTLELSQLCKDSSGSSDARSAAAVGDLLCLSHLTALSSLQWTFPGELRDITFPPQPVKLVSSGGLNFVGSHNLPHVEVRRGLPQDVGMLVLLQLPAAACNTHSLKLDVGYIEMMSQVTIQRVGTALAALTNLTQLSFSASGPLWALEHVDVLQQLCKLPSLVDLSLLFDDHNPDREGEDAGVVDMLQLLTLTNLTRLVVRDVDDAGMDDVAASAVALSLTGLKALSLCSSSMLSWGFLPVVARLTGLRSLVLTRFVDSDIDLDNMFTPALLQQLSTLTLLTEVNLPKAQLSKEAQQQFLAGLPHLCRTKLKRHGWAC